MESLLLDRLSALSHPKRMDVFRLLMRRCPDALPAGEIATALDLKPSTASVYLATLSQVGLIRQSRAGTSLLYDLDLSAARSVVTDLFDDCCRGRPDMCPPMVTTPAKATYNVLFICTGNAARSIIAEAILRHLAPDRFNVYSAGTCAKSAPNPRAIAELERQNIDVSNLYSKDLSQFRTPDAPQMDFVFTICDRAANADHHLWPNHPICAHWGLPDPSRNGPTSFQSAFTAMWTRLQAFTSLKLDTFDRVTLQNHMDDIARTSTIS